jgi:hypothetical protein
MAEKREKIGWQWEKKSYFLTRFFEPSPQIALSGKASPAVIEVQIRRRLAVETDILRPGWQVFTSLWRIASAAPGLVSGPGPQKIALLVP